MAINSKVSTLSTQASGGEEIVRITVRKGNEADFLPSEMIPGELAISTDKGIARYCYSAGKIKVFATREDIYEILGASAEEFEKFQELIEYLKQNQNVYDEIIANLNSLEENKQNNLIESLSGASEYVSEAHDGAGIIRKFPGKTYQMKTNGYQLFDASKFQTKSSGGATVTNNDDGSFTVSGSGSLSSVFYSEISYGKEEITKLLKAGKIYYKQQNRTVPYFGAYLINNDDDSELFRVDNDNLSADIEQSMLNLSNISLVVFCIGNEGISIQSGTVKPMIYQDGDGTWEPYTGGKPGPNPEYPLKVQGVGDSDDGEYAAVVKSHTLQLFDASKFQTKSGGGATVTNNGDGSFTVSGSGNLISGFGMSYTVSHEEIVKTFKAGTLYVKSQEIVNPFFYINLNKNGSYVKTILSTKTQSSNFTEILQDYINDKTYTFVIGFNGNNGDKITPGTVKPMLYQDGDGTWQPFVSSESRIPISHPMYDGDYAYIKDGELWFHRENGVAVFDGTESTNWSKNNSMNGFYQFTNALSKTENAKGTLDINTGGVFSNVGVVKQLDTETKKGGFWIYNGTTAVIVIKSDLLSDYSSDALKTWLQSNPITVVYKLAIPTEEKITSAEPYTLRTYTPQTRIWTPGELKPDIEVDIPKNLAGGYATDGYAQAMKNQAATAEQEAIKARLLSLEQLAIKEV